MVDIMHSNYRGLFLHNTETKESIDVGSKVKTNFGYEGIVRFGKCEDMTINCGEYDVTYFGFYLDIEFEYDEHIRCDVDLWRLAK